LAPHFTGNFKWQVKQLVSLAIFFKAKKKQQNLYKEDL